MLPDGVDGIRATLKIMIGMVKSWKKDPGVRQLAVELTQGLPQGDIASEVKALHAFVRDSIRYVNDTAGVETVQTPKVTLENEAGDCDDKSILLASLLQAIGRPARFIAVAISPNDQYSHVLVQTLIGKQWYSLETIKPVEAGWSPSDVSRVMVAHI